MATATVSHAAPQSLTSSSFEETRQPTPLVFQRPLLVANSTEIGGGNTSLLALVQGLLERGVKPNLVHPEDGPMLDRCARLPVRNFLLPPDQPSWKQPLKTWNAVRSWQRILREVQADLIHANEPFTARALTLAARITRTPFVCHVHLDVEPAAARWIFKRLPAPQLFLFSSQQLLDDNWPNFRICAPKSRAAVAYNGIDVERFCPGAATNHAIPRIGMIANLIPIKGHLDFLEMAANLKRSGITAEYHLIGADVHRTQYDRVLAAAAQKLGLDDDVHFRGYRADVPAEIRQLDLVVCASHQESFGLCLAEAMACEKPVVATRVGGIPEVVEDGVTGLVVPPHAPEKLAAAVRRLLDDRTTAMEMARRGRARVCDLFTHRAYVERVLSAYASLAERHDR